MKLSPVWEGARPILARNGLAVAIIALLLLFTDLLERPAAAVEEVPESTADPPVVLIWTSTATATRRPARTATNTPTPVATDTAVVTNTPVPEATNTPTPVATDTAVVTKRPTATVTSTPIATAVNRSVVAKSDTAPDRVEAQCLVSHAATPAQVCRDDGGVYRYYFIGPDGRSYSGPRLEAVTTLAALYPQDYDTGEVEIYRGNNPGSGKEVVIHYLTASRLLRVATYYADTANADTANADTAYAVAKQYILTIDEEGRVSHTAW